MYAPLYQLRSFDVIDSDARGRVLGLLLEALVAANIEYLGICPSTPSLYESGVVYEGAWIALGSRDSGDLGVLDVRGVALGEV